FHRAGDGRGLGQAQAAWGQALLAQQRPGEAVLLLGQAVIGLDAAGAEVSAAQARLELARAHAAQGPTGALRAEHLLLKVRTDAGRLGAQALRRQANTLLAACRRHRTAPAAPRRPPIRRRVVNHPPAPAPRRRQDRYRTAAETPWRTTVLFPYPVIDPLGPGQVETWKAHFAGRAHERPRCIEEGIWRRTQEPQNAAASGWSPEESGRRR